MKASPKHIIFYDGDCGFCNFWIAWILKRDRHDYFAFAALQSNFGQTFLKSNQVENRNLSTLYLLSPKRVYFKKWRAVLEISRILGGFYLLFYIFKIIPAALGDKIYDLFARNRQKFGRAKCYLPSPEERTKFMND